MSGAGLADKGLRGVVVALPVDLIRASDIEPSLAVFGYGLIGKGALEVARVVKF